jgi:hypothetical protein
MKEKFGPYFLEILMAAIAVYLVLLFTFWD